jgi:REP element-mobilizing transposase RayT
MGLSKMGIIVKSELLKTFEIRKNIKLHQWVIMPNHVHLLMGIKKQNKQLNKCRDVARYVSTEENNKNFSKISPKPNTISSIIRSFKSAVTKEINPKTIFFGWQPRFHDEIIKNEKELLIIKNYIINNPINWQKDKFYKK